MRSFHSSAFFIPSTTCSPGPQVMVCAPACLLKCQSATPQRCFSSHYLFPFPAEHAYCGFPPLDPHPILGLPFFARPVGRSCPSFPFVTFETCPFSAAEIVDGAACFASCVVGKSLTPPPFPDPSSPVPDLLLCSQSFPRLLWESFLFSAVPGLSGGKVQLPVASDDGHTSLLYLSSPIRRVTFSPSRVPLFLFFAVPFFFFLISTKEVEVLDFDILLAARLRPPFFFSGDDFVLHRLFS